MIDHGFSLIWLRQQSKHDFEIRALVNILDCEGSQLHHFAGYDKILDELHRIQAPEGLYVYLRYSHLKFLCLKKYGPTA